MKSNRNRAFLRPPEEEAKSLFRIAPILINLIVIAVLVTVYYLALKSNAIPADYSQFAYWAVNVLISYNIIAASARSLIMPILTLLAAAGAYLLPLYYGMTILTQAEILQLIILGVIGFILTLTLARR